MSRPGVLLGIHIWAVQTLAASFAVAADEERSHEERRQALWRYAMALGSLQRHAARLPEALGINPFAWPPLEADDPSAPPDSHGPGEGNAP